jgi:hypothetical protein
MHAWISFFVCFLYAHGQFLLQSCRQIGIVSRLSQTAWSIRKVKTLIIKDSYSDELGLDGFFSDLLCLIYVTCNQRKLTGISPYNPALQLKNLFLFLGQLLWARNAKYLKEHTELCPSVAPDGLALNAPNVSFWNTKMFLKFRCACSTNAQYYTLSSYTINSTARINFVADFTIGDCDPACVNGGVCNNEQCFCPDGYTGKTCSDGKLFYLSSGFKFAQLCCGFVV